MADHRVTVIITIIITAMAAQATLALQRQMATVRPMMTRRQHRRPLCATEAMAPHTPIVA